MRETHTQHPTLTFLLLVLVTAGLFLIPYNFYTKYCDDKAVEKACFEKYKKINEYKDCVNSTTIYDLDHKIKEVK